MKNLLFLLLLCLFSSTFAKSKDWLEGKWKGTGFQIDGKTWSVEFTKKDNSLIIDYPSLACSGKWKLIANSNTRIDLEETITFGAERCDQGCKIVVFKINADEIAVIYYLPEFQKNSIANAVLVRQ